MTSADGSPSGQPGRVPFTNAYPEFLPGTQCRKWKDQRGRCDPCLKKVLDA